MSPRTPLLTAPLLTALLLVPLLALAPARSAHAGDLPAQAADHLSQAEHFARKGWYADADAELRAGLASPGGSDSFELHWLAAQVAWELLDVPRALEMAQGAARTAPDDDRRARADALVQSYQQGFGIVVIDAPQPGMVSRLQVEPVSPIFDADLKRYVNQLSLALRDRTPLPVEVGLPVGSYQVNGHDLVVQPGERVQLDLPMKALGARGLAALQVTRLELGLGVGLLLGDRVVNQRPGPTAQAALTQPIGPVLVGVMLDGNLAGYSATAGQAEGAVPTWNVGLRIGREVTLGGPLAFRPSLQYRYGYVPGLPYACQPAGPDQWSCRAESDSAALNDAPLAVYATGRAHRPGVELALDYRQAGRTTALGTGVRLVVDQAIGSVPARSDAVDDDAPDNLLTWTTTDRSWTATGLQMLGALSIAF